MWKKNTQNVFSANVYTNFNEKERMTSRRCMFWAKSRFEKRKKTSRTAAFREVPARTKRRRISLYIMKREIGWFLHCFTAKTCMAEVLFAGFWNGKDLPKRVVENESTETEELGNKKGGTEIKGLIHTHYLTGNLLQIRRCFRGLFIQKRERTSWWINLRPSLKSEKIRFVKPFFQKFFSR